ncbi:hypothetical protein CQ010_16505 [Arthrobacter sp. MYb211]|nr:hypothetical protein CQ015_16490 [Arthrobacter sp. MYb221]PRC04861.1 hypothetical protein CQ010_16505 [Arthrobacter sp. MYb211]
MYICSSPECLRVTGFQTAKGKPRAVAQAAHILPAAKSGPRRDAEVVLPDGTKLKQGDEGNAIWLCLPCHVRADADPEGFPAELLLAWKREHEERASSLVGLDLEQSLLKLGGVRQSHDLARDLLLWLDGHRFMYVDGSCEFPAEVRSALDSLRVKLVQLRASVYDMDTRFGKALQGIETAVLRFFAELSDVRIDEIVVTSGVSDFELFSQSLEQLRQEIKVQILPLAREEGFKFTRIRVGDE